MKTIVRLFFTISILFSSNKCLLAKQNPPDSIIFSGSLNDKMLGKINGFVYINYDPDDWFFYAGNSKHLSQKTDKNGWFRFSLPDLRKPYKINVLIRNNEKKKLWSGSFFVDSQDDVQMQLVVDSNKRTIGFNGNGKENYNLALKLDKQYWEEYRPKLSILKINIFNDLKELDSKTERLAGLLSDFIKSKQALIEATPINNRMKDVLADEFAWYKNAWHSILFNLYKNNPNFKAQIYSIYTRHSQEFGNTLTPTSIYCPIYMSMASSRIARESMMTKNGEKTDIKEQYNIVKERYSGIIKDRMIGQCFFNSVTLNLFKPYSYQVMDSLLADAEQIVSVIPIKYAISVKRQTLANINLKKIINASFFKVDGKPFDLKSLHGKVILIDTWFNGCIGCANFHKKFEKEVFPKFKQNPRFAVLGINVDKKKEEWLKGIATNRYTSLEYININTGDGIGFEHPFTKYYNIQGSPTLMLIDADGNIIYQPPLGLYSISELTTKIQQALGKLRKDI